MGAGIKIVENDSLKATAAGYELRLRLNWYRSLPLSCVERIQFSLDGQDVDAGSISLEVNGRLHPLAELPELVEEYWFVQDSARLVVHQPGAVQSGTKHLVNLEYLLRFPYIAIGPGRFLANGSKYSAEQTVG